MSNLEKEAVANPEKVTDWPSLAVAEKQLAVPSQHRGIQLCTLFFD